VELMLTMLLFAAAPISAFAQKPVTEGDIVEMTAEIVAIDHDARMITLEDEDGESETIFAGPEVKRFDDLKVGDKVTFRYYESLVFCIVSHVNICRGTFSGEGLWQTVLGASL
jgi:Cu/Ag efflux protein CusF